MEGHLVTAASAAHWCSFWNSLMKWARASASSTVTALYRDARIPPTDLQGETKPQVSAAAPRLWPSIRWMQTEEDCPTCVPSVIAFHAWKLCPETSSPVPHPPLSSLPGRSRSCGSDRPPLQGTWGYPGFSADYFYLFHHGNYCSGLK